MRHPPPAPPAEISPPGLAPSAPPARISTCQHSIATGRAEHCEAQTVRNSGMAVAITRYLDKEPRRKLVVLTGVWHAVKYGIPDQLRRLGTRLEWTVILPETPYLNSGNSGASEADYLVEL
ncbi:ChaN family lipoprotein [Geomonas azotofigens]|uniref:ChaN family lipoprotein n=1 Tax=Geomonas azotofigens TaxID=2843196 RepID=UPI002E2D7FBD|nr:ChaN family lipoprotein [Geomonas azotofigens]